MFYFEKIYTKLCLYVENLPQSFPLATSEQSPHPTNGTLNLIHLLVIRLPPTQPQEKLKRALEISQTISIQFLLSRQCLDSVWTVSRHILDSVWAVYRQCPDSVSTVSERCSIHPQENLKQAWEKSQTMSRQCLDCV